MKFQDYLPFYRRNLAVALPVMITQAGQVVVQLADNIMVGQLGAAPLAGVSFANAIVMIGIVFTIGFAQGITPIVGQSFGKGDHGFVSKILCNAFLLNMVMSVLLTLLMVVIGFNLDRMGQEPDVTAYAKDYFHIMVATFIPMAVFFTGRFFSEGIGNTKNAMMITIFTNLLNIFLNWVLIYGKLGAPRLEVAGAAYATMISRVLAAVIFAVMLFRVKEYRRYTLSIPHGAIGRNELKQLLHLSVPIGLQGLLEVTAFSGAAIMVGWMGKYELAAHQITNSLSMLTFMVATGIGAAATIRVSHQFGAGKYQDMFMAGKAAIHMAIAYMVTCGLIFVIFHNSIPCIYTQDEKVIPIASRLILVLAMFQVFDATQLASMASLRGLKDIKIPLIFSATAYYGICLPTAYLLGFKAGLGPVGVWLGLLSGLASASLFFYLRFVRQCKKYL